MNEWQATNRGSRAQQAAVASDSGWRQSKNQGQRIDSPPATPTLRIDLPRDALCY
jgi:hypothetical protein